MSQHSQHVPPLRADAPGINGFKYTPRSGVIVVCKDEVEHRAVYERLHAEGYTCKVVRV